jgi:hypothetical protein
MAELVRGIDVSEYQGVIAFADLPDSVKFVIVRLREWRTARGGDRYDQYVEANLANAGVRGIALGTYVRVDPVRVQPEIEALLFVALNQRFGGFDGGMVIPAVDIESVDGSLAWTTDPPSWTRRFFREFWTLMPGQRIRLYTNGVGLEAIGGVRDLNPELVTVWAAHFSGAFSNPKNPTGDPALAEEWAGKTPFHLEGRTTMHQYFNKGRVPGIAGDALLDCLMPGVELADLMQ